MTENEAAKPSGNETVSAQPEQVPSTAVTRSGGPGLLISVIAVFVIAMAVAFYLNNEIRSVEQSVNSGLENITGQNDSNAKRIETLTRQLDELRLQADAMANSIAGLYQQQPASNEDWALSEIEYLLIIAAHRIILERDIDTALAAMEAAELRLRDLDNPDLVPVREQFVADINRLKAVNNVDITGLSIYLADIVDRAATLPLKKVVLENDSDPQAVEVPVDMIQTGSGWRNFLSSVWQELKGLVVIKRSSETRKALLLPDQEYFLYQNLRLELENARLSVLRRDTENLRVSVNLLTTWLEDYFDTGDAAVVNVIETLQKMSALELKPDLPDINSSLETLRAYMRMDQPGHAEPAESDTTQP